MAKLFFSITKRSNGNKVSFPELVNVYYTALMIFLVFTAAKDLVKELIETFRVELMLYVLLWGSMVIQTTFAYKHIKEILPQKYNKWSFLSDCFDICIFIFVCAAIGKTSTTDGFKDLETYQYISIPFLILSVNQFFWYVTVREEKKKTAAAILRLILLFIVMLITTVWDSMNHNVWILAIIAAGNFFIMVVLRSIDKAPTFFENLIERLWKKLKKNHIVKKVFELLSAPKNEGGYEAMNIQIEEKKTQN